MFCVFQISCAVTKPKLGLSLGTKVKICCTIDSRWRSSGVGRYRAGRLDIDVFLAFFFQLSSRLHRCDQSDDRYAKSTRKIVVPEHIQRGRNFRRFEAGRRYKVTAEITSVTPRRRNA